MWLLRTDGSYRLENFHEPPHRRQARGTTGYAILSHTWEDEEVTFKEIQDIEAAQQKKVFRKITLTCKQARVDGLDHAWIDTCCIDKDSSAELSEAINSMFNWYATSAVCYVFLADMTLTKDEVSPLHESTVTGRDSVHIVNFMWHMDRILGGDFILIRHRLVRNLFEWRDSMGWKNIVMTQPACDAASRLVGDNESFSLRRRHDITERLGQCRWFFRCWTLQELIGPDRVVFFDQAWNFFGERTTLASILTAITAVPRAILRRSEGCLQSVLDAYSIAKKFSWASKRTSTREEDAAYSLLGLFDVNMPLLYGEGSKALIRLQEAMMPVIDDHSILLHDDVFKDSLLSTWLFSWREAHDVVSLPLVHRRPFEVTGDGLRVTLPLATMPDGTTWIVMDCRYQDDLGGQIGIHVLFKQPLQADQQDTLLREPQVTLQRSAGPREFVTLPGDVVASARLTSLYIVPPSKF